MNKHCKIIQRVLDGHAVVESELKEALKFALVCIEQRSQDIEVRWFSGKPFHVDVKPLDDHLSPKPDDRL